MTAKAMLVDREEFLQHLQSVQAGLASKEIIEQSACFVFQNGAVTTFNSEIACTSPMPLEKWFKGAVDAKPLLDLFMNMKDKEVELSIDKEAKQLVVRGKKKRTRITMNRQILLDMGSFEEPTDWQDLHKDFADAVDLVALTVGKDQTLFRITCVHICPKYIESTDNIQVSRYRMKTGFKDELLVRGTSVKHITSLGIVRFCETEHWVHFKNPNGLIFSCRRFLQEFPGGGKESLDEFLEGEGEKTELPKALAEAIERANIFAESNTENKLVTVELSPGKVKVHGLGMKGEHEEWKSMKTYHGKTFSFMIDPKILKALTEKYNECEITEDRILVKSGKFTYMTCLARMDEDEPQEEETDDEDDGESEEEE